MKRSLLLGSLIACGVAALDAQARPGQNVQAELRIVNATRTGDTTSITYRIVLSPNSPEGLSSFTLNASGVALTAIAPTPADDWIVATSHGGRAVAHWAPLARPLPGDSTPSLTVKGAGLPGLATAWLWGDSVPSMAQADSIEAALTAAENVPLEVYALQRVAVGIDPYPSPSHFLYESRLKSLSSAACLNGWITNAALCTNLGGLMSNGQSRVLDHIAAIEDGHRAGHMNSLAYWMLKVNGEATLEFIDPERIDLTYVCGNRFRISNANYVPIAVTYRRSGASGADTVTLAGRATDSAGPVETQVEITGAGAVQLLHKGIVIRTSTPGGVTSCP